MSIEHLLSRLGRPVILGSLVAVMSATPPSQVHAPGVIVLTAPRVRDLDVPPIPVLAFGGGEVMLEVTVGPTGAVIEVAKLRATPPFTDPMAAAVRTWTFDPAIGLEGKQRKPVTGRVLVIGLFRPPTLYSGPAPGGQVQVIGEPSADLPRLVAAMPVAYPPMAVGSRVVVLELAVGPQAEARGVRVVTPPSGFDGAALHSVQGWQFAPPRDPSAADPLYVYVVLGFRTPIFTDPSPADRSSSGAR